MTEFEFIWEVFTASIIALTPIVFFSIRAFIRKGKCFVLMKQRIESLENVAEGSGHTHEDLYDRVETINEKQIKHGVYLTLILDHLKIPYEK